MKIESEGILIGLRPLGERDLVGRFFTRDNGIVAGMIKAGAIAKKNRALIGQCGNLTWVARLDSQLGAIHWDATTNLSIGVLENATSLRFFNAIMNLIDVLLPERAEYKKLYDSTINTLVGFNGCDDDDKYLNWEIALLRELGYAIDLSHCSGCGATHNLHYLSPKTYRAVCDVCAEPYINRVYKLPITLQTTFGLLQNVCAQQGIDVPKMRVLLNG